MSSPVRLFQSSTARQVGAWQCMWMAARCRSVPPGVAVPWPPAAVASQCYFWARTDVTQQVNLSQNGRRRRKGFHGRRTQIVCLHSSTGVPSAHCGTSYSACPPEAPMPQLTRGSDTRCTSGSNGW
jgi:hypothetical protein